MPSLFQKNRDRNSATAQGLIDETGTQGGAAREAGLAGALAFDPSKAVDEFGSGFLDEAREGLGQDFESLTGEAVGRGRLRTGFFQRDGGRLFQDFNRRVSNAIAQSSLQASGQQLANIQGLQGFGGDMLGQQTDLLGGALDRATADDNAGGGNFLSKALGFAGGLVAPGIGDKVGSFLGDKLTGK